MIYYNYTKNKTGQKRKLQLYDVITAISAILQLTYKKYYTIIKISK